MSLSPREPVSRQSAPQEAVEVVVAAGPALIASLAPLVAAFARLAGLGVRHASALAGEVLDLVATAARGSGPVRLRLLRCPQSLRVRLQCGGAAARVLRKARAGRALNGFSIEAAGRNALVMTLSGPFQDR
ncbi:MAG: hypothetical protein V3U86_13760 [Acidobacteriota bacterium]|nr:hypothetical protein [Acidobacteriota bacterium]